MNFTKREKDEWFACCEQGRLTEVRGFLTRGMDPDARDGAYHNGLWHASVGCLKRDNHAIIATLIEALGTKYATDPLMMVNAMKEAGGSLIRNKATQEIVAAATEQAQARLDQLRADLDTAKGQPVLPSQPLRLDRTVTLAKLQERRSGATHLQILSDQQRLSELFTPAIWAGRSEEMERVWQKVRPEHRTDVDIDALREQLGKADVLERFGIAKDGWGQGL